MTTPAQRRRPGGLTVKSGHYLLSQRNAGQLISIVVPAIAATAGPRTLLHHQPLVAHLTRHTRPTRHKIHPGGAKAVIFTATAPR